jgi:hypothetical protein
VLARRWMSVGVIRLWVRSEKRGREAVRAGAEGRRSRLRRQGIAVKEASHPPGEADSFEG